MAAAAAAAKTKYVVRVRDFIIARIRGGGSFLDLRLCVFTIEALMSKVLNLGFCIPLGSADHNGPLKDYFVGIDKLLYGVSNMKNLIVCYVNLIRICIWGQPSCNNKTL